jgi:hypothetical protein
VTILILVSSSFEKFELRVRVAMIIDSLICSQCRTRLTTADETLFELASVDSGCPLCDILSKVAPDAHREYPDEIVGAPIVAFGTEPVRSSVRGRGPDGGDDLVLNFYLYWRDPEDDAMETIVYSSKIWVKQLPVQIEARVPDGGAIEYTYFRKWIDNCSKDHAKCNSSEDIASSPVVRVLDCQSRKLVPANSEPYLTLSYVWGNPTSETNEPGAFPPTIEDAMSVTLQLGFEYLWVDRYCIDQENKAEVAQQVAVMDLVYRESALTIIAACGASPQHGLPGVSRRRLPYHESESSSLYMREVRKRDNFITQSRWNERGWTYQEVFFAKRRLIFTDYETYCECAEYKSWESSLVGYHHCPHGKVLIPHRLHTSWPGRQTLSNSLVSAHMVIKKSSLS